MNFLEMHRILFDGMQREAKAAYEVGDIDTWQRAATEIYRWCGGNPEPGWDPAVLWDGKRPWSGWHEWTEDELREYVAGLDK